MNVYAWSKTEVFEQLIEEIQYNNVFKIFF